MIEPEPILPEEIEALESEPDPLIQSPPVDRYCDLVLTGGIASGVAYPWAVLELSRHYRFRNIAGSSIGAVAAALAAASEYGRCRNLPYPFEVVRKVPHDLAARVGNVSKMRALFQPHRRSRWLFELLVDLINEPPRGPRRIAKRLWQAVRETRHLGNASRAVRRSAIAAVVLPAVGLVMLLSPAEAGWAAGGFAWLVGIFAVAALLARWALHVARAVKDDVVRGVVDNGMGFCSGIAPQEPQTEDDEAFVEWMHKGIQKAAGLRVDDRPLTFSDLWTVERSPTVPGEGADVFTNANARSINLEIMVTNVTHGRPYRFPIVDGATALHYVPDEWRPFFPPGVIAHLERVSLPYAPGTFGDPLEPGIAGLRRVPVGELPIVVAARMSMSFPLLFSSIPVYAVDRKSTSPAARTLKPCRLADGGICSNFPIHLFDAAIPSWPTFGLWLTRRLIDKPGQYVWLPKKHVFGGHDEWFDEGCGDDDAATGAGGDARPTSGPFQLLCGYVLAVAQTMHTWPDLTRMRLPHVRNRVARFFLRKGEGSFNIGMSRQTMLGMAHRYGLLAGRLFCARFAPDAKTGEASTAWREHLYVRTLSLLHGLEGLLRGMDSGCDERNHSVPIRTILQDARHERPLSAPVGWVDPASDTLTAAQVAGLLDTISELRALEGRLRSTMDDIPYRPQPGVELRLRPGG